MPESPHNKHKVIAIIAAVAENRAIGYQNQLLYHIGRDMQHFRMLTTGSTIIMGRKTFQSLRAGALGNRRNIVLSTQDVTFPDTEVFHTLDEALEACDTWERIFIIGGANVYEQALPIATHLLMTEIHHTPQHADAFFPEVDYSEWEQMSRLPCGVDERTPVPLDFVEYKSKKFLHLPNLTSANGCN